MPYKLLCASYNSREQNRAERVIDMKRTTQWVAVLLLAVGCLSGCGNQAGTVSEKLHLDGMESKKMVIPTSAQTGSYSAMDNTMFGWGFKKNKNAPPELPDKTVALLDKYGAIFRDRVTPRTLYLTFDEGYENGYTASILDTLKKQEVPAAFFITGPYLEQQQELVKRMIDEGHVVGNHTVGHPSMPSVTDDDKLAAEITGLNDRYRELFGQDMTFFRPPRGEYSERTLALTRDLGYTSVFWSFAYKDWDPKKQPGTEVAYQQIMDGVHDGAVLLLHAVSKDNAEVLDRVIGDLKQQGYSFRSLEDFTKPQQPAQ